MQSLTFREENGERYRLLGMHSQIAEPIRSSDIDCALRASKGAPY